MKDHICFCTGGAFVLPEVPIRSRMREPASFVPMKKRIMLRERQRLVPTMSDEWRVWVEGGMVENG